MATKKKDRRPSGEILRVPMTAEGRELIEAAARLDNLTVAEWCRRTLVSAGRRELTERDAGERSPARGGKLCPRCKRIGVACCDRCRSALAK